MNKEEIIKLLGENIKLDILSEYITQNEIFSKAHNKRLNYQKYILDTESKINSVIHKCKFYLSEMTTSVIGIILVFIILQYIMKINNMIILVIVSIILGGITGHFLSILSEKIARSLEKDNLLKLEEELHEEKQVVESCKVAEDNYNEIIEVVRRKTHNNLDKIKLNYDGDIYLLSIINSYILLKTDKCNNIRECEKFIQENDLRKNDYNIVLYLEKNESFEEYYKRYIDEAKFGLDKKERDILKNISPIDKSYQDSIIRTTNECKNLID